MARLSENSTVSINLILMFITVATTFTSCQTTKSVAEAPKELTDTVNQMQVKIEGMSNDLCWIKAALKGPECKGD